MGYIYIIKNTINNKVYIGQTIYSIEKRYEEHLVLAEYMNTKLYAAMRSIGIQNFYIELIEECDDNLLNYREQYWIAAYNSMDSGYNSTRGGSGTRKIDLSKLDRYIAEGKSKSEICIEFGVRRENLSKIRTIEHNKSTATNEKKKIDLYSKEYQFIKTFESVKEAYEEFHRLGLCNDVCNFYYRVKQSCEIGCIASGYRWRLHGDTFEKKVGTNIRKCKTCGKNIRGAKYCRDCYNIERKALNLSYEQLLDLMTKHNCNCESIAKELGVTSKTIRQWCRKVGIELSSS